MSSMKSKSSTIRRPKTMNHADSKSLLDDRNINGIYFIHSMKKLKDFKSHQQQANITSNVIYSDFKLKMSRFGYYYIYAFINIEDSSVYSFDLNKGELQIFKGDNYQVGKLIACGNSCQVTLEPGIFLLSIVYKHEEDEDSEEFVSYSSVSPDLILEYSSIGVAWPLNVRNIEKQVIPKEKCHLPVNDLFMPVKTESRYLQLDNRSVSSMSSRSPLRRPIAPNKIKRRESDPNEMRDMLEYKEHLERQVHYYASMTRHTTQMLSGVLGLPFDEEEEIRNDMDYTEFLQHGHTKKDVERGFSPLKMQNQLEFMKYLCISSLLNLLKSQYNGNADLNLSTTGAIDCLDEVPVELWVSTLVNKLNLH